MFKRRKRGANERRRPAAAAIEASSGADAAQDAVEGDEDMLAVIRQRQQQRSAQSRAKKASSSVGKLSRESLKELAHAHSAMDGVEHGQDAGVRIDSVPLEQTSIPDIEHIQKMKQQRRQKKNFIPLSEGRQDERVEIGGRLFGRDHDYSSGVVREMDDDEEPDYVEMERTGTKSLREISSIEMDDHEERFEDHNDAKSSESVSKEYDLAPEDVVNLLQTRIAALNESHNSQLNEQRSLTINIQALEDEFKKIEEKMSAADKKYLDFQRFQDIVTAVLSCLTEKAPMIEEVQHSMVQMWEDREVALKKTMLLHWRDEEEESFGNRGAKAQANEPDDSELDEFGRPLGHKLKMQKTERFESRQRRKAARQSFGSPKWIDQDGWTTYGDSDVEKESEMERLDLIHSAQAIFDNVIDEFQSINTILALFSEWRSNYQEAYENAYCSLSLPTIVASYVRLDMLAWHPLHNPSLDFMPWKQQFDSFNDPAAFQNILTKVVLPYVVDAVRLLWNPLSLKETIACARLHQELLQLSDDVSALTNAIRDRLTTVMHWLQPFAVRPNDATSEAQLQCCVHRWGQSLKVLHVIALLCDSLGEVTALQMGQSFIDDRITPLLQWLNCLERSSPVRQTYLDGLNHRLSLIWPPQSSSYT